MRARRTPSRTELGGVRRRRGGPDGGQEAPEGKDASTAILTPAKGHAQVAGTSSAAKRFASVEPVEAQGREVVTLGPEHSQWREPVVRGFAGALVRLRPSPDVEDEQVTALAERLRTAGAERVVVLPRRKVVVIAPVERVPMLRARDVVLDLCERARVEDSAVLRELCERVMAEEGL